MKGEVNYRVWNGTDNQGRARAWTFWECALPVKVQADRSVQDHSMGVDLSFSLQPDSAKKIGVCEDCPSTVGTATKISVQCNQLQCIANVSIGWIIRNEFVQELILE